RRTPGSSPRASTPACSRPGGCRRRAGCSPPPAGPSELACCCCCSSLLPHPSFAEPLIYRSLPPEHSGRSRLVLVVLESEVIRAAHLSLLQGPRLLAQQLVPHLVSRRLVEPVEEVTATGRLAQALIDLEAHAGEELLHFSHRFKPVSDPSTVAQG